MNGLDVLNNAALLVSRKGLAIGAARDSKGGICTAAALVNGARAHLTGRFNEAAYLDARRFLASSLGIAPSYDAIADWNDRTRRVKWKDGEREVFRTTEEVVNVINKARKQAQESVVEA